jgi:aldose 1-epimerase
VAGHKPELTCGPYRLVLDPDCGGSIAALEWHGLPLLRPTVGETILDSACFPMVPWCNRIAHGRFGWEGREIVIPPNFPGADHPHPLHGEGWLLPWQIAAQTDQAIRLELERPAGDWPWPWQAWQQFDLTADGLTITLGLINRGTGAMPAGLGFHPYFPLTPLTRYHGLHRGEWQTDADCLPVQLDRRDSARDWWDGAPLASRHVDTVYAGREGYLTIVWPERQCQLTLESSANLPFTGVYNPPGTDWFCIEPMSQPTDAVNARARGESASVRLALGEQIEVSLTLRAAQLEP